MHLCPYCKTDNVEQLSSIGLRAVGCIVLLFIPYLFLLAWIPFVFPFLFRCRVCGMEWKREELEDADWRKKEDLSEKQNQLEEELEQWLDTWVADKQQHVYKIVKNRGFLLMLRFENDRVLPFMIETIHESDGQATFKLLRLWEQTFPVYRHQEKDLLAYEGEEEPNEVFSDFGKEVLNEEERLRLETDDSLLQYAERTVSIEVFPAAKKESRAGIQKEEDDI